ncbi:MAG: sensor histidine kinase [Sphingobacteriales bacterium]|nr:sensor histidine kinase [Sphingobacteriales bacterium]
MSIIYYNPNAPFLPQLYIASLSTTLSIPACWYAANKLVPRFLYQKKIAGFIGRILLLVIINVITVYLLCTTIYHFATGKPILPGEFVLFMITLLFLFVNLIFISIACGVKIIADRYGLEERLHEIEKEKITTELNFLRSQINPHFLFNILNTIYFQIDKSNLQARASVEKFSEMLRYQLYDCNTDKIEIKKEIDYIQSYVALQSQRLETGTDIQLHTTGSLEGFAIAPFMILTLVENAFKHVSHFKDASENKIHIDIQKKEQLLMVKAVNTYDKNEKVEHLVQSGRLGIQNLKRRLELLYPDKAQLSVYSTDTVFESVLNLQLA